MRTCAFVLLACLIGSFALGETQTDALTLTSLSSPQSVVSTAETRYVMSGYWTDVDMGGQDHTGTVVQAGEINGLPYYTNAYATMDEWVLWYSTTNPWAHQPTPTNFWVYGPADGPYTNEWMEYCWTNDTVNGVYAYWTNSPATHAPGTSTPLYVTETNTFTTNEAQAVVQMWGSMLHVGTPGGAAVGATNLGSLFPAASNAHDLGSSEMPWREGYFANGSLYLGGTPVKAAAWTATTNQISAAYIYDCWPEYNNTTNVTITRGEGRCWGKYFKITNEISHNMVSLASGQDIHYLYVDYSASTFPSTVVVYDSTNEPTSVAAQGWGWYCTTSTQDRVLGALLSDAGGAILEPFVRGGGRWVHSDRDIQLASNMNPDESWQTPDDSEASVYLPVTATKVLIQLGAVHVGSNVGCGATSYESAVDHGTLLYYEGEYWFTGYNTIRMTPTVTLGASRNIRVSGENDDGDNLSCWFKGWEEVR